VEACDLSMSGTFRVGELIHPSDGQSTLGAPPGPDEDVLPRFLAVGISRAQPVIKAIRSRATAVAGRIVLAVGAIVALPGFVSAVIDIATEHT